MDEVIIVFVVLTFIVVITLAIYIICQTRGINRVIYSRIRIPGQAANQWTSTTSLKELKSVKFNIPDRRYQNEKSDYLSDPGAPPYFPPPLPPIPPPTNPYYETPIEKETNKQKKQLLAAEEGQLVAAEEIKLEEEPLSVAGTSSQELQDPRILKLEAAIEALIDSNSKLTSRVSKLKLTTKK